MTVLDARLTVGRVRVDVSDSTVTLTAPQATLRPDEARAVAAALVVAAGAAESARTLRRSPAADEYFRAAEDGIVA